MAYLGFIAIKPIILGLILISKLLLSCRRKSIELPPDTQRANDTEEIGNISFLGKLVFHANQAFMTQFGAHRFISLRQQPVTVIFGYAVELVN